MPIREIQERYRELGRLRMGERDESGAKPRPKRLDTWRLTSPSLDLLKFAAGLWGGEPEAWENAPGEGEQFELVTEVSVLPVLVPPQDVDAHQWYELWSGGGIKRRCDGELDFISNKPCICAAKEQRDCKPTTQVKFFLPDIPDIGTWRLVTRGWNAAAELPQTIRLLRELFPTTQVNADLALEARTSKTENAQGKSETHHFVVPALRLPFSLGQLMDASSSTAQVALGRGGRPPVSSGAPELPADARFEHDQQAEWGERPALPGSGPAEEGPPVDPDLPEVAGSEHHSDGTVTPGPAAVPSEQTSGPGDGEKTVGSGVRPEEHASEAGGLAGGSPPAEDPALDEPATADHWKRLPKGKTGNQVLKRVRELYETDPAAWPGNPPNSQSQITKRQLAHVLGEWI